MRMWMLFCLMTLLTSCGWGKKDNHPDAKPFALPAELVAKKAKYCELGRANGEAKQWNLGECDSLLQASLWGAACGELPIEDFMDKATGQWFRDTGHKCFIKGAPDNGSKSSISKDMFRGLFHYFLSYKKSDAVNKTIEYGKANNWVMGDAEDDVTLAGRCVMTPSMISELYDLQTYLEKGSVSVTELTTSVVGVNTGFEAHLQVLGILQQGRLYGGIRDGSLDVLKAQAERQPDNSLFQFSYRAFEPGHNIDRALAVLNDEKHFPSDRLPSSSEHCVGNLFEHDQKDSDWLPCADQKPGVTFSGTDFVFAVSVLDGTLFQKKQE